MCVLKSFIFPLSGSCLSRWILQFLLYVNPIQAGRQERQVGWRWLLGLPAGKRF